MARSSLAPKAQMDRWSDLIKGAKSGDEAAIEALVDETRPDLYRFLVFLCGNETLAQDICQEAYVRALQNLDQLEDPTRFMPWIKSLARNLFIDLKRLKSEQALLDLRREADSGVQAPEAEQVAMVREVLARLAEEDREVLILVDMENHSYSEAGEILGVSESAIRSRLHRARKEFLKIFKK